MKDIEFDGIPMGVLDEGETVEGALVMCTRVDENDHPARGSLQRHCARCECAVWVHPTSLQAAPKSNLICSRCFMAMVKAEEN